MLAYQILTAEQNTAPSGSARDPLGMSLADLSGGGPQRSQPADPQIAKAAWCQYAGRLADWVLTNVVVRTDSYGSYRCVPAPDGTRFEVRTNHCQLTRDRLIQHFSGDLPQDRIAVYTVSPDDETCKVTVVNIDAHGPEDDPNSNWAFAKVVARRARSRGIEVLVLASNGVGGYHVWCFHSRPIPCAEAYRFGKWLVHDWGDYGLGKEPESLPKSPALTGKRFGQPIRLPGRHPKRDYWTAVWGGATEDRDSGLFCGTAAIDAILRTCGQPERQPHSPLVPADYAPANERRSASTSARSVDPEVLDLESARAREALVYLGQDYFDNYDRWLRVGLALRHLGNQGLDLWHEWSSRSSGRYQPDVLDQKWTTFASPPGESPEWAGFRRTIVGLGTLFDWAKKEGWQPPGTTAESMAEKSERYRRALQGSRDALAELALRLGVSVHVLERLGVGWKAENVRPINGGSWIDDGPAWTFPVMNGLGEVIGIQRRYLDETIEDRLVRGSKPGLYVPSGWQEFRGPILITESVANVAYLIQSGCCAIGRPSVTGGVEHLARLLKAVDRQVIVVGEDDRAADGRWPGKERAKTVAQALATRLGRKVKMWLPPEGCKSVREVILLRRDDSLET